MREMLKATISRKAACYLGVAFIFVWGSVALFGGTPYELKDWQVEGKVLLDTDKVGPDGNPSIRLEPKSQAILKLRPADGSGKVTLYVYDDGMVASPNRQKAIGPRWGLIQANGRVLVGGIMYASFFQPEGSLALIETKLSKNDWNKMKFAGTRGTPGWKKWEFNYVPNEGLHISIDDKAVSEKYFDWNQTQATGFNGIVLLGDATPGASPQTIWVSGMSYELGEPMKVNPTSLSDVLANTAPVAFPGPTLAADLNGLKVSTVPSYATAHPRLLFFEADQKALQRKAKENPKLWAAVMDHADRVKVAGSEPTAEMVKRGDKYWQVEFVQSAALAWLVTGDKSYGDGAIRWMETYCREKVWGTLFRPNLDLAASWYLYHLSIAYDILYPVMDEAQRKSIRESLAAHAGAIYDDYDPMDSGKIHYDQNHTYIPITSLLASSLALMGEVPEAQGWLNRSYAILRRSRYVQGEDGYYYEGYGYWTYALHWQVRAAELLTRATGEKLFDIPFLKDDWRYALYMSLPGTPGAFNVHDSGLWDVGQSRPVANTTNMAMLWAIASATGSRECQTLANHYMSLQPEASYPASAFLWYNPSIETVPWETFKPYYYFADHGVVTWRSGWQAAATSYLFRCGPPEGHRAAEKLPQMRDWDMNAGHVHPNIGAFWIYAKGSYLAVETGYTAKKWTRDHNTLLIDGKGQGADGTYHNDMRIPYANFDGAKIDRVYLNDKYGFASGEFGSAYTPQVKGVSLRRSVLMSSRWMLVIDDMDSAEPHQLTWFCHTDVEPRKEGAAQVARLPQAALAIIPLAPAAIQAKIEPTIVQTGLTISEVAPEKGRPIQHGWHVELTPQAASKTERLITLLAVLDKESAPPEATLITQEKDTIVFNLKWPDGKKEKVELNLAWKINESSTSGPATLTAE